MGFTYTQDQQKVIDLHDRNILVAAAAGSGKTAVLVERIVAMISNKEKKIDIDRLLIVTFTNAAASEMRERISDAIIKRLEKFPEDEHLQRQTILIHNAQITTIDSFCLFVIRNHFNDIGLDPGFRVADAGELTLLKQDVLAQLLETEFGKDSEEFIHCVETYSMNGSEKTLEEYILKLYDFSRSEPWPEEWLLQCKEDYAASTIEKQENAPWMKFVVEHISEILIDSIGQIEEALIVCEQPDGPYMYAALLEEEKEILISIEKATTFLEYEKAFSKLTYNRLPSKKDDSVDPAKREIVKTMRNEIKEIANHLKSSFFYKEPDLIFKDLLASKPAILTLLDLVLAFSEGFSAKKREKNIVDFSDMEHFALDIFIKRKDKKSTPTPTADAFADYFEEILIDEYQDSNSVQEFLLTSISKERQGKYNRFMVGDVKQSIYKFRLARPKLFMEKYRTYTVEDSREQKIDLHKNFRSRSEVIEAVNYICEQSMEESIGGISYDQDAVLHRGADYQVFQQKQETELLLAIKPDVFNKNKELNTKELEASMIAQRIKELVGNFKITDKRTKESRVATYADIVILLRSNSNWDEPFKKVLSAEGIPTHVVSKTGYFSALEVQMVLNYLKILDNPYQDIPLCAVMLSPIIGFSEEELAQIKSFSKKRKEKLYTTLLRYMEVGHLAEAKVVEGNTVEKSIVSENIVAGIVVVGNTVEGNIVAGNTLAGNTEAGNTVQKRTVAENTDVLRIEEESTELKILALKILAKTDREATHIETQTQETKTQETKTQETKTQETKTQETKTQETQLQETRTELQLKIKNFHASLSKYRQLVPLTPINELMLLFTKELVMSYFITAMPAGEQRKANLDMLFEKAVQFEKTSYHGLFHFIRYMEQIEKYEVDFGEANILDENSNTIRIMSIHKSKGLEFPICFVAGIAKRFNMMDIRNSMIIDMDHGIGVDYIDPYRRIKMPTLRKNAMVEKMKIDNIGEELRILYVALTRAKEKLIMTGVIDKPEKKIASLAGLLSNHKASLSFLTRWNCNSYLDFIMSSLIRHRCFQEKLTDLEIETNTRNPMYHKGPNFIVKFVSAENLIGEKVKANIKDRQLLEQLQNKQGSRKIDERLANIMEERFSFTYPYEILSKLYTKTTVSELKRLSMEEGLEPTHELYPQEYLDHNEVDFFEKVTLTTLTEDFINTEEREIIQKSQMLNKAQNINETQNIINAEESEILQKAQIIKKDQNLNKERDAFIPYIPKFMGKEETMSGSSRGNAYHKIMELLNFSEILQMSTVTNKEKNKEKISALTASMEEMQKDGKLSKEYREAVEPRKLLSFCESPLAKRMMAADQKSELYKEQPFVIGVNANRIDKSFPETEIILVQGIIDAYFEEDDGIVVVDYKTDKINRAQELVEKYKMQLDYYAEALERLTGKEVKEKIIYSFSLGKEIQL